MTAWENGELKNPLSGKQLARDAAHSLSDGDERFPLINEIAFLRQGKDDLRREAVRALDLADERAALTILLQDQDDWARGAPPKTEDLQLLFDNPNLTLREAMRALNYGAVADYFAYRWSDPTFLSGLALLQNHLPADARNVFELCCGIGHYLREFELRGVGATGADVVFSKLWLARKIVAPTAKLVCCDANFDLPFAADSFDHAFCHDAFYFLPSKARVADELKRVTRADGAIMIGHAHNAEVDNFSSGAPLSVGEYAAFFTDAVLYDDSELTRSIIENRKPQAQTVESLRAAAAVAVVANGKADFSGDLKFDLPLPNRSLRINPLLADEDFAVLAQPQFPSDRYEAEYAEASHYLILGNDEISFSDQETAFDGRWSADERLKNLVRRRIFLDLPEKW